MRNILALLAALLLAPLAALHDGQGLSEAPPIGQLRAGSFQAFVTLAGLISNDWN